MSRGPHKSKKCAEYAVCFLLLSPKIRKKRIKKILRCLWKLLISKKKKGVRSLRPYAGELIHKDYEVGNYRIRKAINEALAILSAVPSPTVCWSEKNVRMSLETVMVNRR